MGETDAVCSGFRPGWFILKRPAPLACLLAWHRIDQGKQQWSINTQEQIHKDETSRTVLLRLSDSKTEFSFDFPLLCILE